jgi:lipopolysaccharide/colanic/teichoic acid biosynthesis glycosyltransferase
MKRAFDLLAAAGMMVILGVPLIAIAVALRLKQGPNVLFKQQRIGRFGHPFDILKFRTMRPVKPGDSAITAGECDLRVTPLGAVLRRFRIDEWPQLWNVLRGDMSLVGPRPEVPEFVDLSSPEWQLILKVRPGVTGPDALVFKDEGLLLAAAADPTSCYRQDILPKKMAVQSDYAQKHSFAGDLKVLFRTLGALRG